MKTIIKLTSLILLIITVFSCSKDPIDKVQFDINSSKEYFQCDINGELIYFMSESTIIGSSGRIFPVDSLDSTIVNYKFGIVKNDRGNDYKSSFEIVFYKSFHSSVLNIEEPTPDSIFRNILSVGEKQYINNDSYYQNHKSGILINWTDSQGTNWASAKNVENTIVNEIIISKNRTFEITHSIYQDPHPQLTLNLHKIKGIFNCVLYNLEGDSITMSNGEFVGVFSNRNL